MGEMKAIAFFFQKAMAFFAISTFFLTFSYDIAIL
jgi:hypothetical protein